MQRLLTRGAIVLAVGLAAVGLTACNKYGLTGHIDGSYDSVAGTTIVGWANAADPKFKFVGDEWATVVFADKKPVKVVENKWTERPDVVKAVGPNSWGYEATVEGLTFGDHEICVDVVPVKDVEKATVESNLECKTMFVPQHESLAHFDSAVLEGNNVDLVGWIYNSPYQPDGPWTPYLTVDGFPIDDALTPGTRTDVSNFLHEPADTVSGVDLVVEELDAGPHEICLSIVFVEGESADVKDLTCVDIDVLV